MPAIMFPKRIEVNIFFSLLSYKTRPYNTFSLEVLEGLYSKKHLTLERSLNPTCILAPQLTIGFRAQGFQKAPKRIINCQRFQPRLSPGASGGCGWFPRSPRFAHNSTAQPNLTLTVAQSGNVA
ncbi:hypothetical protein PCASD_15030 [Puccinia coronata f. sp. avenae]|uniref:Uncharacterized protein n=1 Tax=Puccinia coronata f. sp. avenae TaxID=200324 RepID=A0A2N5U8Z8_9BASI|nr:hypothetical protein PCASD_15030 [Puccinia coronata f. sp. avenae]